MTEALPLLIVSPDHLEAAKALNPPFEVIASSPEPELELIQGRNILAWPENTAEAKTSHTALLTKIRPFVGATKITDSTGMPEGWGLQSVIDAGNDWTWAKRWAIPRCRVFTVEVTMDAISEGDLEPAGTDSIALWEKLGLVMGAKHQPLVNLNNALRVFQMHEKLKGLVWFDEFHDKVFTNWKSLDGNPREWTDADDRAITIVIQRECDLQKFDVPLVREAIQAVAENDVRNEPRDWVKGLKWDGVNRLERFFIDLFGCDNTPYHEAVGKNFWLSMVARFVDPVGKDGLGQKVDNMVILRGEQGAFKSTALEIIGGRWYVAAGNQDIGDAEFLKILRGKILLEFADLKKFRGADQNTLKACITIRKDTYRDSFGRRPRDRFRTCIFAGTTNDLEIFQDETGARRFWTLIVSRINLELIKQYREQFFAEAYVRYQAGEIWWEVPQDEHKAIQDAHYQMDEWEEKIKKWLDENYMDAVSPSQVWEQCFDGSPKHHDRVVSIRINKVMKHIGWEYKVRKNPDGSQARKWVKPTDQKLPIASEPAAF